MLDKKMTINLEEFLQFYLKKWKVVGSIIGISIVLFVAAAFFVGDEIVVPHSEEYLKYEQELEWHESYLEESILMNLNPTCIYQRSIFIKSSSDMDLLKDYVMSAEIWTNYKTDWSKKYISELLRWNQTENENVEIVLRHASSEECEDTAEYLKKNILAYDEMADVIVGSEKIVTDENLQEEHLRWYSRIDYVNTLLLDAQAGYTIKVNKIAAALVGGLAGTMISIGVVCGLLVNKRRK